MINSGQPTKYEDAWHFYVPTPRGRGAIATISIHGPSIFTTLGKAFLPISGRELATYPIGSTVYGRFHSSDAAKEDVVLGIIAADEVEIHCHGGPAAVAAICETLQRAGGMERSPQDWLREQTADKIAAEALLALADAKTERAAAILLDQYRGALSREIHSIGDLLAAGDAKAASVKINDLLARADVGLHLTTPWKVVLTGRPNVGKSSLMNAILGYERSIVWHQPGTTRDVLTAATAIDGWWVEFSDVAGLRTSDDALEAAGVALAEQEITAADLLIFVADLTTTWDAELYRLVCNHRSAGAIARPVMIVHNKCDLVDRARDDRPGGINTSAVTGIGLLDLGAAIVRSLAPIPISPGSAVPFVQPQIKCLQQTLAAIDAGDLSTAQSLLAATGH